MTTTPTPTPTPNSDERAAFEAWYKAERFGDPAYQNVWHAACEWQAARTAPEGMVTVPREPTDAMAVAAIKASLRNPAINGVAIYRAMIEAAPAPEPVGVVS